MFDKDKIQQEGNSKAPICKSCGVKTYLTSFRFINNRNRKRKYNKNYSRLIYMCPNCHQYVNVHKGTNEPLGFPGDKELRLWRVFTHYIFDKMWQKLGNRNKAYKWLARKLKISIDDCHIGKFDSAQCKTTIELCIKEMSRKPND